MNVGIDIVKIDRIKFLMEENTRLDKIFTKQEQDYAKGYESLAEHLAGMFAVKEAVAKALKTGFRDGLCPKDIEVLHDKNGAPMVVYSEKLKLFLGERKVDISISHEKDIATAICIIY